MHIQRPEQGTSTTRARKHDHTQMPHRIGAPQHPRAREHDRIQRPHRIGAPQHPPCTWARRTGGLLPRMAGPAPPVHVGTTHHRWSRSTHHPAPPVHVGTTVTGSCTMRRSTSTPRTRGHDTSQESLTSRCTHVVEVIASGHCSRQCRKTYVASANVDHPVLQDVCVRFFNMPYAHSTARAGDQHPPCTWARPAARRARSDRDPAPPAHVGTTP